MSLTWWHLLCAPPISGVFSTRVPAGDAKTLSFGLLRGAAPAAWALSPSPGTGSGPSCPSQVALGLVGCALLGGGIGGGFYPLCSWGAGGVQPRPRAGETEAGGPVELLHPLSIPSPHPCGCGWGFGAPPAAFVIERVPLGSLWFPFSFSASSSSRTLQQGQHRTTLFLGGVEKGWSPATLFWGGRKGIESHTLRPTRTNFGWLRVLHTTTTTLGDPMPPILPPQVTACGRRRTGRRAARWSGCSC